MFQQVTVTRLADRHASVGRDYAASHEVIVEAGTLPEVLAQVLDACEPLDLPLARYSITLSEPYD
jgi:hypothetical protein